LAAARITQTLAHPGELVALLLQPELAPAPVSYLEQQADIRSQPSNPGILLKPGSARSAHVVQRASKPRPRDRSRRQSSLNPTEPLAAHAVLVALASALAWDWSIVFLAVLLLVDLALIGRTQLNCDHLVPTLLRWKQGSIKVEVGSIRNRDRRAELKYAHLPRCKLSHDSDVGTDTCRSTCHCIHSRSADGDRSIRTRSPHTALWDRPGRGHRSS
jgi:hypothetical protein